MTFILIEKMIKELLTYSYKNRLAHIPSALSMLNYIDVLFSHKFITPNDYILLGKPFGAQAYYLVWQKNGFLNNIESLSLGVKHDEIPFVHYSEETIGNALGVAAGIAFTTKEKIWVNITDASLQMGNTLEAIQFIGQYQFKNILVTIDYNDAQVTGKTSDIIDVSPCKTFFKEYNWNVIDVNGHDELALIETFNSLKYDKPTVVYCNTKKGFGKMLTESSKWHYNKISSEDELNSLIEEYEKHFT